MKHKNVTINLQNSKTSNELYLDATHQGEVASSLEHHLIYMENVGITKF